MWFKEYSLEEINTLFAKNMTGFLGIEAVEIRDDAIIARMPITDKVKQPYGLLHGGASVVLAESVGSVATNLIVDPDKYVGVGLEVNANHLRPVLSGEVIATCTPLHIGGKTHIWDIKIRDSKGKLTCVSRLTVAIIRK
ncbi:hotdog fold thioesterase [Sphingobacterium sp. lm-10]|uniref:hotdog fold thioesterase n=1 Tax=Sphingobacterium sp. lm-10 TaxID=2944904 RepID=UPI0020228FDB|nr:hotdog fold thioesterase [Sphingobacterium sp. lm-10]MCL7988311.1 hotdog fold thioesterase [Sphingobacterium sp. lm-10]